MKKNILKKLLPLSAFMGVVVTVPVVATSCSINQDLTTQTISKTIEVALANTPTQEALQYQEQALVTILNTTIKEFSEDNKVTGVKFIEQTKEGSQYKQYKVEIYLKTPFKIDNQKFFTNKDDKTLISNIAYTTKIAV